MTRLMLQLQLARWWRDRRIAGVLVGAVLMLGLISAWSTYGDIAQRSAHTEAAQTARAQWEGRGAAHPHSMAHFGDFAFRPSGPLARLDRGVQARLGKVLRIEGHRQGTPIHADAARAGTVARYPRPDAAFFLHTVVPLLLMFLGAAGLASDRETGRLRLSLVQGIRARAVATAHFLALWGLGLLMLAVLVLASWVTSLAMGGAAATDLVRLLVFAGTHALFLAIVAAAIVAASVWLRTSKSTLLALLAVWVAGTAVLPRAATSLAGVWHPLPSRDAFQADMQAARAEGPDGHNPKDQFVEQRRQEILDEYGVTSVDALPLDFGGIAMQLDEDFGNRIWDEHRGRLEQRMRRQSEVSSWAATLNPFQAVDHLSMTIAGTDLMHDLDFQREAEGYRRELIGRLNHEHAYGGAKTGERGFKATPAFYASIDPFHYAAPTIGDLFSHRAREFASMWIWCVLLVLTFRIGADRIERGVLPC